jgi:hypothetical protein
MNTLETAAIIFGSTFGCALLGMLLHRTLPDRHLDSGSQDVVKLVMGLIATMAALVLSLLIASGSSSFQTQQANVQSLSANVILLDRMLTFYGPEANETRVKLHQAAAAIHDEIWSPDGTHPADLDPARTQGAVSAAMGSLEKLAPKTDTQGMLKSQAMQIGQSIGQTRLLMFEQSSSSISWPFLTILVFWLCMLFIGFGLFARFNATVTVALFIGAVSVAGAIFLILELNEPYKGFMPIADTPLRGALVQIGRSP